MKKNIKQLLVAAITITAIGNVLMIESCTKNETLPPATVTKTTTTTTTTTTPTTYPGLSPSKIQRPLLLEETATWCQYCPAGGTVMMKQMVEKYPNVIGIALHQEFDPLNSSYPLADSLSASAFQDIILKGGIPDFNVDNQDGTQFPESIIQSELALVPTVGVGANSSYSASKYTIKTRVKFYTASTGNYYMAVYALQDGIIATGNLEQIDHYGILSTTDPTTWVQNNASYTTSTGGTAYWFPTGTVYTHDHVITAGADGITSAWGQALSKISYSAGDSIDFNFTITANSNWKNANIVAVLWELNTSGSGAPYQYVNGYH